MRRDVFQAIADPTRRAILSLMAVQSMTPNAVSEHFSLSRQAVSKHIRILSECGLLRHEQKGREIVYHLNASKMDEVEQWLGTFRNLLAGRFDQLDEVLQQLKNDDK